MKNGAVALGLLACSALSGCSSLATGWQEGKLKDVETAQLCAYSGEITATYNARQVAAANILKERGFYDSPACKQIRGNAVEWSVRMGAIEDQRRADEAEIQRFIDAVADEVERRKRGHYY